MVQIAGCAKSAFVDFSCKGARRVERLFTISALLTQTPLQRALRLAASSAAYTAANSAVIRLPSNATARQVDRRYSNSNVASTWGAERSQPLQKTAVNDRGYSARLRQAPNTSPLIAKATNGRPISIKISGQGFVSKAENTAVAYSTKRNANQHRSAIFNPAIALAALN